MPEDISQQIVKHYDSLIEKYGFKDSRVLNYASYENQVIRFVVLTQIQKLEGCRILDVGCGLGDLAYYLEKKTQDFEYLGIDLNESMVEAAREKYPQRNFEQADVFTFKNYEPDFVMASGLFGQGVGERDQNEEYFLETIKQMYAVCKKGIAFNVLNSRFHPPDSEGYFSMDLSSLYELCIRISKKLTIRHDYLEHDLTIYLYK